ncbi:MAG: hypothetical protein AAGE90_07705 [Pseudomonadota bacterium]
MAPLDDCHAPARLPAAADTEAASEMSVATTAVRYMTSDPVAAMISRIENMVRLTVQV